MTTRIQVRLDKCYDTRFRCTAADEFLIAALGGDNAIAPGDVAQLGNGGRGKPVDGMFRWDEYQSDPELDHADHNRTVIQQMVNNVMYLQDKGAPIPDFDWDPICDLLEE
jgi:hypothetical protein